MSSSLERYRQKMEIFRSLREFRLALVNANLLRSQGPKLTVTELESFWISIFGTTSLSCDLLQFLHALDTCRAWPDTATLKDKALLFKLLASRTGECSLQTGGFFFGIIPFVQELWRQDSCLQSSWTNVSRILVKIAG